MHARIPDDCDDDFDALDDFEDSEATCDSTAAIDPECEQAWLEEIRRRRSDPAARVTIDAEEAFDKLDALLAWR